MIVFENVAKSYPGGRAGLRDISFRIEAGELLFVTGHSGAGKSTLLRLIALEERATRGRILLGDTDLARVRRRGVPALRRRLGLVFQDHRLLLDRTVFDNVALPLVIAGVERNEIGGRVRAALDRVGLLDRVRAQPLALSGGEQQRVGIARAIVAKPPLILADEPTGNLDPRLSIEIFNLFKALSQTGTTILIASHDLHLIQRMRRRVLVLDQGALIDDFRPELSA